MLFRFSELKKIYMLRGKFLMNDKCANKPSLFFYLFMNLVFFMQMLIIYVNVPYLF